MVGTVSCIGHHADGPGLSKWSIEQVSQSDLPGATQQLIGEFENFHHGIV